MSLEQASGILTTTTPPKSQPLFSLSEAFIDPINSRSKTLSVQGKIPKVALRHACGWVSEYTLRCMR